MYAAHVAATWESLNGAERENLRRLLDEVKQTSVWAAVDNQRLLSEGMANEGRVYLKEICEAEVRS